jgi:type IV pilus assembly protein PilM
VILGLDPPHAEFIALEVPEAVLQPGNADVNQVVHFEIQRLSALAAKAPIQSDYWRLPRASTAAPNVLGVAAAAEHVASLLKFSEQAGLQGCRVEAGALALSRFGALLNDWPEGQVWGVLDLGRAQSRLVLVVQEVPVLIRLVGGGGKAWTDRIASSLRVSRKSAETLKQEHGVDSSQGGTILTGLLRNDLHEVASEIKRSYEYVLSCYPAKKAGGLVLAGGGAAMPKLDELLGGLLGIPVTRAGSFLGTPGCRLRFDDCLQGPREIIETGAVAIGLAVEE